MTVRSDVAELLHAGYGDRTIARQLGVTAASVTHARTELGLHKARGGTKTAGSVDDLFWRRVQHIDGGHLRWTGSRNTKGTPQLKWGGRNGTFHTAYRVAFRIRHGRDPIGYVHPACDYPGCVAPDHVTDSSSSDDIVTLLRAGHSDRYIGRALHVDPCRVGRLRSELGLAKSVPAGGLSLEQKWSVRAKPVTGGHMQWTGSRRDGMPNLIHRQRNYSARRVAFQIGHGREPVGRVLPGCDQPWCIAPEHATDTPMRRADHLYTVIFGAAA